MLRRTVVVVVSLGLVAAGCGNNAPQADSVDPADDLAGAATEAGVESSQGASSEVSPASEQPVAPAPTDPAPAMQPDPAQPAPAPAADGDGDAGPADAAPPAAPAPAPAPATPEPGPGPPPPAQATTASSTPPGTYLGDGNASVTSALGGQSSDGEVRSIVQAVGPDGRQNTVVENDATASGPGGGNVSTTVVHEPDQILLAAQALEGDDGDLTFLPEVPVLLAPLGAADGFEWGWTMTSVNGRTTVTLQARILGREMRVVGAQTLEVTVVQSEIEITNPDLDAMQTVTTYFHEPLRLSVAESSSTSGTATFNGAPVEFEMTSDMTLRSGQPA